jgi:hypothetical protein
LVAEDVRRVSENPNVLIAEATRVVTDCERYLEAAEELVVGIPARRRALMERIAAAEESLRQEEEKYRRLSDEEVGKWELKEADRERERASWRIYFLRDRLAADDLQPENRKAVARQLAGLVREDAKRRLSEIAARSDDPKVRRTVAECKDEIATSTYRFIRRFTEAWSLTLKEVKTARAEAHAIFDRLRNPPVDRSHEQP